MAGGEAAERKQEQADDAVRVEDIAGPDEMGVEEANEDEPGAAAVVDGGRDAGEEEVGAGGEEEGEDGAHFAIPESHGDEPGGQVEARRTAVDGGVHVGGEGEAEGDDVQEQDAEEGEAAEGVEGLDAFGHSDSLLRAAVLGGFGDLTYEAVGSVFTFVEFEGVVEGTAGGAGLVREFFAVDIDDLVELGIFGGAGHPGGLFEIVHFGAGDGDDIDGAALFGREAGLEVAAAVGVVVAGEDHVDFVFVDDGLPHGAEFCVVAAFGGGEDGVMEGEDGPAVGVV